MTTTTPQLQQTTWSWPQPGQTINIHTSIRANHNRILTHDQTLAVRLNTNTAALTQYYPNHWHKCAKKLGLNLVEKGVGDTGSEVVTNAILSEMRSLETAIAWLHLLDPDQACPKLRTALFHFTKMQEHWAVISWIAGQTPQDSKDIVDTAELIRQTIRIFPDYQPEKENITLLQNPLHGKS